MTYLGVIIWGLMLILPLASSAQAKQKVVGDYSVNEYLDGLGYVSDIELFTKQLNRQAYFGITCTSMSALPMVQVIVFDEALISETPKLVSVQYALDKTHGKVIFNGVLKVVDTAEELSNKVVWDPDKTDINSLQQVKQAYRSLFSELSANDGKTLNVVISHKRIKNQSFQFSTLGLSQLLKQYEAVCF